MSPIKTLLAAASPALLALLLVGHAQAVRPIADRSGSLIAAVKDQDKTAIKALLARKGVDVRGAEGDGTTALHWAVLWNDADTVAALIKAGAKVNAATDQGVTPLSLAALNANPQMVDVLIKAGADPKAATGVGETILMTAARTGDLDVVRRIVDGGADVNAASLSSGQTALMWAAAEGHTSVVGYLLQHGADAKARSKLGSTPILFAAQRGDVEAAKALLKAGADVNDLGPEGPGPQAQRPAQNVKLSALLIAIDSSHEDMAKFLLDSGADPNLTPSGRAPLHSATQRAMPNVVKALIAKGANVEVRLSRPLLRTGHFIDLQNGLEPSLMGATPFLMAADYGDVEIMKILLAAGADPKAKTTDNSTALMLASGIDFIEGQDKYGNHWFQPTTEPLQDRQFAAMKLCVEAGIDVNAVNDKGQTALHGAVYYGGTRLASYLLDHGAKINVVNKRGQTPWLIVSQGEYRSGSYYTFPETAKMLETRGADTKLGKDLGVNFAMESRTREVAAPSAAPKPAAVAQPAKAAKTP